MLLSSYYDANDRDEQVETQLLHWMKHYGLDLSAAAARKPRYPVDSDPNPFVRVDLNKCILCTRCIRACAEIQGRFVWGLAERGYDAHIAAGASTDMIDAAVVLWGVRGYCPTGALKTGCPGLGQADKFRPRPARTAGWLPVRPERQRGNYPRVSKCAG
jgi:formate dehydrogenase major subunit/formate dehydrogenase alpha subunit